MANRIDGNSGTNIDYDIEDAADGGDSPTSDAPAEADESGDGWGLGDVWEKAKDTAQDATNGIRREAGEAVDGVKSQVDEAVDGVKSELDEAADGVMHEVGEAAAGIEAEVGQAVDDFGELTTKTVAQMQMEVDEAVSGGAEEVSQRLDQFDRQMREIGEVPDRVIEGGRELYLEAEQKKAELVEGIDGIIDQNPREAVEEAVVEALEGGWDIVEDTIEAARQIDIGKTAGEAAEQLYAADAAINDAVVDVKYEVIELASEQVIEHRDLIEGAADFVSDKLDSEFLDKYGVVLMAHPMLAPMEIGRRAWLSMANGARHMPGVAKEIVDNEQAVKAMLDMNNPDRLTAEFEEIGVGAAPFQTKVGVKLSAHHGVGGEVGISSAVEVSRPDEDTYRVTIDTGLEGSGGLGEEIVGKGVKADLSAGYEGKLVVDLSGDDAAENAARLIAAARGEPSEMLMLTQDIDADVITALGSYKVGLDTDAGEVGLSSRLGLTGGMTTRDGREHIALEGSYSVSAGVSTGHLQVPDNFGRALAAQQPDVGNPLMEEMLSSIPPDLAEAAAQVYGPQAGLTLSANPSVELGIYAPTDGDGPVQLEFSGKMAMEAGRSQLEAEVNMSVNDLGGLSDALGMSRDQLVEGLKDGTLSPQGLVDLGRQAGADIDRFVDIEGPSVMMSQFDGYSLDTPVGGFAEGRMRSAQAWPPTDGRTVLEQLEAAHQEVSEPLDSADAASSASDDNPEARLAYTHATQP